MTDQPLGSPDDAALPPAAGGLASTPQRGAIPARELGSVTLTPDGDFVAGSHQTFTLVYTAGKFGIDDSGSLRICFRFASDQTRPQFENPQGPNYTTIVASNSAVLQYHYDPKGNVRPWDRTLYIKVVRGFLREGDTITVTFGDRSRGSPGMRLQTFCEDSFEFHTLVDPIATYCYQPLPEQPTIRIVPGAPESFVAVLPTLRRCGETFALKVRAEDLWGNPTDKCDAVLRLESNLPVAGLPETLRLAPGAFAATIEGLSLAEPGELRLRLLQEDGTAAAEANPLRIVEGSALVHFWGDLHGQSEETIGTGSARQYFAFARDRAFLDATGHQGNDFQITTPFWRELDALCAEFDRPGSFVAIPGYEWSGNTGLGGDRNIYFPEEGRILRRSSHALVEDRSDIASDANSAAELFQALADNKEWDVVGYAHCGGRYADVKMAHDGRFEKSMEVHSSWGTFEWLVQDAFEMGYRVGIVANSDGHKGRPGASYPGASLFGAVGGLTCFLTEELSRAAILDCLRKRHHYATTGGHGGRPFIDLRASLGGAATLYHDDPRLGPSEGRPASEAIMGDFVQLPEGEVELQVDIAAAAPIERVDLFNGLEHLETLRPYGAEDLGNRIRVVWEGAEYRGRFRQVIWDGSAHLSDNSVVAARPINFFNRDKTLDQVSETELAWRALTTGNIGGFDLWVADPYGGTLKIETPLVKCGLPLEEIGLEDEIFDESGVLPRYLKVFRLPTANPQRTMTFTRRIALRPEGDNPIFIRVTQEDGTLAWTSPIYLYR
ncbi:DUF3604 domain-containing protein [Pelagibius marinus]|uniref:DUF3604 domain-containing protein n=1 Tax=Pelagibius marinus TaxID=2762760 RepID=UPI0029C9D46C|nr:DUF3604 domain-containing protein [Pelagibius marinus]